MSGVLIVLFSITVYSAGMVGSPSLDPWSSLLQFPPSSGIAFVCEAISRTWTAACNILALANTSTGYESTADHSTSAVWCGTW